MEENDPFAEVRIAGFEVSTSFTEALRSTPFPQEEVSVERGDPQKTALFHLFPPFHEPTASEGGERPPGGEIAAQSGVHTGWADGLAALELMELPHGATAARWQEIVADARTFVSDWGREASECGWSTADVFGLDPFDHGGPSGLVLKIRSGTVTMLTDGVASVRQGNVVRLFYPGLIHEDTPPLWDINRLVERRGRRW